MDPVRPKIRVSKDKETYLATLYGKALDAAAANPILGDHMAADAVARLDCDFAALKLPRNADISLSMRAKHLDGWTRSFLMANPGATVLHLGCGLDTRVYRVDPSPDVRWFDVDMPEVIALREQLYPDDMFGRVGYQRIGASVTELAWLDAIASDKPVFVIGEGLFMYLPEPLGVALLRRITEKFPSGEVAFDGYSVTMTRLVSRMATLRGAKVELVWGIDDPHRLETQVPGLRLVEDVSFLTMPELVSRLGKSRLSAAMMQLLGRSRFYRNLVRHLRYAFAPSA